MKSGEQLGDHPASRAADTTSSLGECDLRRFMVQLLDFVSPLLDTYEQAIYLYLFRHTRLIGKAENVIGFRSARARMACGIGEKGRPMSESTAARDFLRSLYRDGFLSDKELEGRLSHLERLENGNIRPSVAAL